MANETKITTIVSASAFEQLEKLDSLLNKANESYKKAAMNMAKGLSFDPKDMTELIEKNNRYMESLKEIQKAETEINRLREQKKKVIQEGTNEVLNQIKAEQEAARVAKAQSEVEKTRSKEALNLAQAKRITAKASEEEAKAEISSERAKKNAAKADQMRASSVQLTTEQVEELIARLDVENLTYKEQARILSQLKAYSKQQVGGVSAVDPKVLDNIQKLDKLLKEQDAMMGVYGRNVGNYASAWNGLGNAINQISREMPAFAVSMSTGILALSNNIPILADEIARIRKENAQLIANGQKAVPVWKQIAGSLLSWQTLLSVGITLLTVYGDEIFDFVAGLFETEDASKAASDALKDLTSSSGAYFEELKNISSTYGENVSTVRRLQEEWNGLGGNLEKQKQFIVDNESKFKNLNVSVKDVSDAENLLVNNTDAFIRSLELRAKYTAAQKLASEQYAKALQLSVEAENRRNNVTFWDKLDVEKTAGAAIQAIANPLSIVYQGFRVLAEGVDAFSVSSEEAAQNANKAADAIEKQKEGVEKAASVYMDAMRKIREEEKENNKNAGIEEASDTEKLKRREEQAKREAEKRMRLELDAERTIQEARIALMDEGYEKEVAIRTAQYQKRIDDAKKNGVRVNEQIAAIEAERDKELSEFREEYERKRSEIDIQNRLSYAEKGSMQELDLRLDLLQLQKDAELREAEQTGADKLTIEEKYLKLIEDTYLEYGKRRLSAVQSQNELEQSEREIALNNELSMLEQEYAKGIISKEAYEKKKSDIQYQYATQALQEEIALLEESLYLFSGDERIEMEKRIARLRVQLSKETTDKINEDAEKELKVRQEIEKAKEKLIQEAANAIGEIGSSIFERRIQMELSCRVLFYNSCRIFYF